MKLYVGPLSMFSGKVLIALAEKGLDFERELVSFSLKDRYSPKHPEVLRINPKAQVPVLVDGGLELYDSTQIFEYLEDKASRTPLWPFEPEWRALARQIEMESDELLFGHVLSLFGLMIQPDPDAAKAAFAGIQAAYDRMEARLVGGSYLAGTYSYADIALICAHYFAALMGADIAEHHAELAQWRERMIARPAVAGVLAGFNMFLRTNERRIPAFAEALV